MIGCYNNLLRQQIFAALTALALCFIANNDNCYKYYSCYGFSSQHSRVFVGTPKKANPRLVRDCMTPNPRTLKTTDKVDEAIIGLLTAGFNGAPVVDPITNNLVGCVSAFDFVMMEETGAILPFDTNNMNGADGVTAENIRNQEMAMNARKIVAKTVGELTTEKALTIHQDTTMKEAAELLTKERKHRLCVMDDNNNLVGILSTSDVMRNVVENVLQLLPPPSPPTDATTEELAATTTTTELTP